MSIEQSELENNAKCIELVQSGLGKLVTELRVFSESRSVISERRVIRAMQEAGQGRFELCSSIFFKIAGLTENSVSQEDIRKVADDLWLNEQGSITSTWQARRHVFYSLLASVTTDLSFNRPLNSDDIEKIELIKHIGF